MARRALGPATLRAVQAVRAALAPSDQRLLVACSGGADSLALAVAALHADRPVSAAVIDHGLQEGSAAVAATAAEQLAQLGMADVVVEQVGVAGTGGPEAAARDARYAALARLATVRSATVLVGHTRDDQAETVLLGLARGSGARSLAGMAIRTPIAGCDLVRPFLRLPRQLTRAVCVEAGLQPWQDPQNADRAFGRPRVRHRVLPVLEAELGPGIAAALARTAELLRADAELLDGLAAEALTAYRDGRLPSEAADLPAALRTRVVRSWLLAEGATAADFDHVAAVDALLTDWHGQRWIDVPGLRVRRASASGGAGLVAERTASTAVKG